MTESIELIRGLAEDAAECGDGDCWDHDVPVLTAVSAVAWLEEGMKMLALDIKAKTEEIERLRKIRDAARAVDEAWGADYMTVSPLIVILHRLLEDDDD
jgi:hypothetical protein